jgi:hypothetical protein
MDFNDLANIVQVLDFGLDIVQVKNDDIMKMLILQNEKYLEIITIQNKEILKLLNSDT